MSPPPLFLALSSLLRQITPLTFPTTVVCAGRKSKGKRFFICSLPLGPGHNSFASKTGRLRSEVDGRFKCDFFVWKREVKE